jgi:putative oxidoreductase
MNVIILIARLVLGFVYLIFGLDFFLHFISHLVTFPPLGAKAGSFLGELDKAGYFFPVLKTIEIMAGVFLLCNRYAPLFTLIVFPITLNIFLFHAVLARPILPMGATMLLANLALIWGYRKSYGGLLKTRSV